MMRTSERRSLIVIGSICYLVAILAWLFYSIIMFRQTPAQDFMVFYTAARAVIDGHLSLLFDGDAFTAVINHWFKAWLSRPLELHPWVYPPLFLLMVVPLGLLPFAVAYGSFLAGSFVLLNCSLRYYVPAGYQRWLVAASLLTCPATAFTVAVGQNAFMTTSLLVAGFGLRQRAPLLAGGLLGLVACKPQLWLMIPVALIAAREWKVLAGAVAAACLVALASVLAFGLEPWRQWLTLMLGPSQLYQHWLTAGRLNGQSAYAEAFLLGAPAHAASAAQALATLLCAAIVWWCFRTSGIRRDLQLAVLLTATILAAPHTANYDAIMVTVAVSLYLCRALEDGFRFGDRTLIVLAWSVEVLDPPHMFRAGLVTPVIFCLFLAAVIARGRSELPAPPRPGRLPATGLVAGSG